MDDGVVSVQTDGHQGPRGHVHLKHVGYYVICACTVVVRPPGSTWTRSPETHEIFCNFAHAQLFQGHQSSRGNVHLKQVGSYVILRMRSKVPTMDTFSESSGILCNFAHAQ